MAFVPADPGYRRQVVLSWLAAVVVGMVALGAGLPAFRRWLEALPPNDALCAVRFTVVLALAPTLPIAVAIGRFALRVRRSGRFPPPGHRVVVDTAIVEGAAAQRRATALLAASAALAAAGVAATVLGWMTLGRLLAGR